MQLYRRGIHMKNKMNINTFIAEYAIIIIFIVLFAAMSIFAPNFLTGSNIANVLRQVSINGICAIGMTFVILTGGIDLSVGAIIGVSGVLTAMMMINNVNPIIASLCQNRYSCTALHAQRSQSCTNAQSLRASLRERGRSKCAVLFFEQKVLVAKLCDRLLEEVYYCLFHNCSRK